MGMDISRPQVWSDRKTVKRQKRYLSLENLDQKHAKLDSQITELEKPVGSYNLKTVNRLDTEDYQHETNNSLMMSVFMSTEGNLNKTLLSYDIQPKLSGWNTLMYEKGLLLLGTSNLARMVGLPDCPQPSGIKHDCILISNDHPMTVLLCHYKDADIKRHQEYGRTLARKLAHAMRNYTGESFNILFDVIEDSMISSVNVRLCLEKLVENNRKIYPFERLNMNAQKKQKLLTSFLDVMSTTEVDLAQCDEGQGMNHNKDRPIYLLNQEEFDVMGCIMEGEERIIHVDVKTSLQRNFFALEVARRLNQDGGALLITGTNLRVSSAFCKKVSSSVSQCDLEDVRHVVEISSCWTAPGVELKTQDGGKHVIFI